jgi:hypothetical protein
MMVCRRTSADTRPGVVARLLHLCRLGLDCEVPDHSTVSKTAMAVSVMPTAAAAERVHLRMDFVTLRDAARFADAFGGSVVGVKRTMPAEVDTIDAEGKSPEAG